MGELRRGAAVPVAAVILFFVFAGTCALVFRWHHRFDDNHRDPRAMWSAVGFASQGLPSAPQERRVLVVGHKGSGIELVQEWLQRVQPSIPYTRYTTRVVSSVEDVVCPDRIRAVVAEERKRGDVQVLLVFREPVVALAHTVRLEHTARGALAQVHRSSVLSNLRALGGSGETEGFTERIIHQLTRQIHSILQCDNAYAAASASADVTERFANCYTYGLCHDVLNSDVMVEDSTLKGVERSLVRTATQDYGILMGMYDCIYHMWKERAGNESVSVVTLEDILARAAVYPSFERDLLRRVGGTDPVLRGGLGKTIHASMHRYHSKEDLEYLPRKLRHRLYSLYQFHMERAAQLVGHKLYVYQSYRGTRGPSRDEKQVVPSLV